MTVAYLILLALILLSVRFVRSEEGDAFGAKLVEHIKGMGGPLCKV